MFTFSPRRNNHGTATRADASHSCFGSISMARPGRTLRHLPSALQTSCLQGLLLPRVARKFAGAVGLRTDAALRKDCEGTLNCLKMTPGCCYVVTRGRGYPGLAWPKWPSPCWAISLGWAWVFLKTKEALL